MITKICLQVTGHNFTVRQFDGHEATHMLSARKVCGTTLYLGFLKDSYIAT